MVGINNATAKDIIKKYRKESRAFAALEGRKKF
jgi:hypothetical protein